MKQVIHFWAYITSDSGNDIMKDAKCAIFIKICNIGILFWLLLNVHSL